MGNDGGSIPKRRELVKSAARTPTLGELKATALESLAFAWTHDPVTSDPLDMENAVSDWRGRIYNYETVLQGLLPGSDDPEAAPQPLNNGHTGNSAEEELTFATTGIKSVRDVVRLHFKRSNGDNGNKGKSIWACPVSMKELGPATKSVYLVPCGHVFAEVAIKEISEQICPVCSDRFETRDIIAVLPTEKADLERLSKRIEELKADGLTHSLKKEKGEKKKKKRKAGGGEAELGDVQTKTDPPAKQEPRKTAPASRETDVRLSGINNAFAASLTAKVLADQDEANKRRKLAAAR